jgi:hypothetical protein
VDHVTHVGKHDDTCAECMAEIRGNLREIGRLCDALPEEVEHRGVNGEALMLLGPVADPEAWGHVEASVAAGRLPRDWQDPTGELSPHFVLLRHQMIWRDALEHDDAPDASLATAINYLDQNLTYMAGFPWVDFPDFAKDLRTCVGHLLSVLHDQERGVRANVPCFECGSDLERRLGKAGFDDHWTCRNTRCERRTYTIAEFNFALRAALETAEEVGA